MIHLMLEGLLNRYAPLFVKLSAEEGLGMIVRLRKKAFSILK